MRCIKCMNYDTSYMHEGQPRAVSQCILMTVHTFLTVDYAMF